MKSYEQLAKSAYEAWHRSSPNASHVLPVPFEQLPDLNKQRWVAVAKQLWAEFSNTH